jgi:TRAP-type C4-dicarboxylate transport system permease small subunit
MPMKTVMRLDRQKLCNEYSSTLLARVNERLAIFEINAACVAMVLLLALNGYAIAARYLFNRYPAWIIEVTETLMVCIVFLGGAWLYKSGRHVAVSYFVELLRADGLPRKILRIGVELAILAFAIVTLWQAAVYLPILLARKTPVLGLPANVLSAAVPIAYASILLAAAERLWTLLRR